MFTFVICKNDLNIAFNTLEIPLQYNLCEKILYLVA